MPKKKLLRFAEMATFPNVIQMSTALQGRWNSDFFHNANPITLELACGKGEYTLALARLYPERNIVGVDLKGARIWSGAKAALVEGLSNVAFLRLPIERLAEAFAHSEVSEIWITFPDPYPRRAKARKRLTSPRFIAIYRQILSPGGLIHLKTDEVNLFRFTQEVIAEERLQLLCAIEDVYEGIDHNPLLTIQTTYEKRHLAEGRTIKYLSFTL